MIYPGAKWLPVANQGPGMGAVSGLCVHVQVGNGSLAGWFNDPASGVSAHWWISKTGAVEQYIDTSRQSWAQIDGNRNYLSVETEGLPTEPLTAPQVAALDALVGWCASGFGFPRVMVDHGAHGVTTHAHYPSGVPDPAWGGHACPGPIRAGQLPAIVEGTPVTPSPPPPGPPVTITTVHKQLINLPTNSQGNGWTPVPAPYSFDKVLGVWISPNLGLGGTPGTAKAGPDGPGTYVEVFGCTPNALIGVWLTLAD